MPYSTNGKNIMLDAWGASAAYASLHTAYPGDTGVNEVAGGSPAYARKAKTWNSSAAGTKDDSNQPTFDVPACTVAFEGFWTAVSAGTFLGYGALGGAPLRYTADASTDRITSASHGFSADQTIVFMNGAAPAGLTEGTIYFVKSPTTNDFLVAATAGGAAIDITAANQAASNRLSKIVQEVFASQGQYQCTDADADVLDA